jgi:replicative DNA helicase
MRDKRQQAVRPQYMEHGKIPPNAVELEEAVLGAVMLDKGVIPLLADSIRPDSFYKMEHQLIFEAFLKLFSDDKPIDIMTVSEQLKAMDKLEMVGGRYYISKLTDRVASSANVEFHARIIEDKAIQRELIRISGDLYHDAFDDTSDPLDLLDVIGKEIETVTGRLAHSCTGTTPDLLREVKQRAELAANTKGVTGLETGIRELDIIHGGRQKGHLIIMAGRPAMGKTAAALCEVLNMTGTGAKVLFISLEMSAIELMQRALSVETGIELSKFRTGEIDIEQWGRINEASARLANSGIVISDDLHTITAIRAEARRMKERGGLDAIYIDYIQLVSNSLSGRSRENEVSEISRALKLMARSMNVPVIALSQLNRGVETRGGTKRPMLSDLRESGSIEQDADVVEFLYRPEYYDIPDVDGYETTQGLAFRIVAKNRHGACRDVPMRFHHALTKFTDWEDCAGVVPDMLAEPRLTLLKPNTNFYEKDNDEDTPF